MTPPPKTPPSVAGQKRKRVPSQGREGSPLSQRKPLQQPTVEENCKRLLGEAKKATELTRTLIAPTVEENCKRLLEEAKKVTELTRTLIALTAGGSQASLPQASRQTAGGGNAYDQARTAWNARILQASLPPASLQPAGGSQPLLDTAAGHASPSSGTEVKQTLDDKDILCSLRGIGSIKANRDFQEIIDQNKEQYQGMLNTRRSKKTSFITQITNEIRQKGYSFWIKQGKHYIPSTKRQAREKVTNALKYIQAGSLNSSDSAVQPQPVARLPQEQGVAIEALTEQEIKNIAEGAVLKNILANQGNLEVLQTILANTQKDLTLSDKEKNLFNIMRYTLDIKQNISWVVRYCELIQCKNEQGHCRVPSRHAKLGSWVDNQRARRQDLTPERKVLLDALGFKWSLIKRKSK